MSEAYEEAAKKYKRAEKSVERAVKKAKEARAVVEEERGKLSLECRCGVATPVSEVPAIEECRSHSWEDYDYTLHVSWVCPACGEEWKDFNAEPFPEGIKKYCKQLYKYQGQETQEVRKLRFRWRKRDQEAYQEEQKKRRVEAAKELLKSEGII